MLRNLPRDNLNEYIMKKVLTLSMLLLLVGATPSHLVKVPQAPRSRAYISKSRRKPQNQWIIWLN